MICKLEPCETFKDPLMHSSMIPIVDVVIHQVAKCPSHVAKGHSPFERRVTEKEDLRASPFSQTRKNENSGEFLLPQAVAWKILASYLVSTLTEIACQLFLTLGGTKICYLDKGLLSWTLEYW